MKLKKAISIVLSTVMVTNLACSYIATAAIQTDKNVCPECTTEYSEDLRSKKKIAKHETEHPHVTYVVPNRTEQRKKLINDFLLKNAKYLPTSHIGDLSYRLQRLDEEDIHKLNSISFHNPTAITLLSVFLGQLGIDRIMIGKVGTGVLKMITGGGFGIWWLLDIFQMNELTKEQNWKKLQEAMQYM